MIGEIRQFYTIKAIKLNKMKGWISGKQFSVKVKVE